MEKIGLRKNKAEEAPKITTAPKKIEIMISPSATASTRKSRKSVASAASAASEREGWGNKYQFFLAALGYAIGLSCIWRFPTLTYQDGGGAFLIPYIIMSLVIGIPMVFLELSVGQYTSTGTLTCWTMSKAYQGIGIAMNFSNAYVCIYYNLIIGYALYYLVLSFTSELPWTKCNPAWASVTCSNTNQYPCLTGQFGRCLLNPNNLTDTNVLEKMCQSTNASMYAGWYQPTFPSQDFWNKVVLQSTDSIGNFGGLVWQLVLGLFVAWLLVFLLTVKGVEGVGNVVYVTTSFPYILLLILGIQGWMLDGAGLGISYYLTPNLSQLGTVQVWNDAAIQVFYTLSISYGGLLTYSSFNSFNANILRDAVLLSIFSCLTSIFCGFVVFPYLGSLAKITGQPINTIIQSGEGFAFILFPYAVANLKVAPLWAILFFIMVFIIGVDNMMASVETTTTALLDVMPFLKRKKIRKYATSGAICFVFFLVGLVFCSRAGIYWVQLFDQYTGSWALLLTATLECLSVSVFYGFENFRNDLFAMLGSKITYNRWFILFKWIWLIVCPALFIFLIIYGFVTFQRLNVNGYLYPVWADVLGNVANGITALSMLVFIACVVYKSYKRKEGFWASFKPAPTWIPRRLKDRVFVNMIQVQEKYTKFDDPDNLAWPKDGDESDKAKSKKKDKTRALKEKTGLPVDVFVVDFPAGEQRKENRRQSLHLDDIKVESENETTTQF